MNRNALDRLTQTRPGRTVRCGFTLVEALLASTILAIVAASVSLPFVAVAQQMNASAEIDTAVRLGEELMEEILARPFYAPGETEPLPGPEASEKARRYYNAVDDFKNYTEYKGSGVKRHVEDYSGAVITGGDLDGFWRQVNVVYVRMPEQAADSSDYSFMRIRVRVHRDDRLLHNLIRIKGREY